MEQATTTLTKAQNVLINAMWDSMPTIDEITKAIEFVASKGAVTLWLGTPSEQALGRYKNWFMYDRFRAPTLPSPLITRPATEAGVMDTVRQKWETDLRAPLRAHGYRVDDTLWPTSVAISWAPIEH